MTEDEERDPRRRRLIALVVICLLAVPVVTHVVQVRKLKHSAALIKVGDTKAQVAAIIGVPMVTYATGYPPEGGPATITGSCHGGLLNTARAYADVGVSQVCNGMPTWYQRIFSQNTNAWPVTVEYNNAGEVSAVSY